MSSIFAIETLVLGGSEVMPLTRDFKKALNLAGQKRAVQATVISETEVKLTFTQANRHRFNNPYSLEEMLSGKEAAMGSLSVEEQDQLL